MSNEKVMPALAKKGIQTNKNMGKTLEKDSLDGKQAKVDAKKEVLKTAINKMC